MFKDTWIQDKNWVFVKFWIGWLSYLPKRFKKSPTEKEPKMPPTEKMATDTDQSVVRVVTGTYSEYLLYHVSL